MIEINGEKYPIHYGNWGYYKLCEFSGKKIQDLKFDDFHDTCSVIYVAVLAGFKNEKKSFLKDIDSFIEDLPIFGSPEFMEIQNKCWECLIKGLPKKK